jgi:hypothetical protein
MHDGDAWPKANRRSCHVDHVRTSSLNSTTTLFSLSTVTQVPQLLAAHDRLRFDFPDLVPVGTYAKESMIGLYPSLLVLSTDIALQSDTFASNRIVGSFVHPRPALTSSRSVTT